MYSDPAMKFIVPFLILSFWSLENGRKCMCVFVCVELADDVAGSSLDQRVSRFHQIQSVSVDNSSLVKSAIGSTSCQTSVLFLLLHGGEL